MVAHAVMRKLKQDDDNHTPEEAAQLFAKYELGQATSEGFEPYDISSVMVQAACEIISGDHEWPAKMIVEQVEALVATVDKPWGDARIKLVEAPGAETRPLLLMVAVEEMAVADGKLKGLEIHEKKGLLKKLMEHGAEWHHPYQDSTPLEEAAQHYPELHQELRLDRLAGSKRLA